MLLKVSIIISEFIRGVVKMTNANALKFARRYESPRKGIIDGAPNAYTGGACMKRVILGGFISKL